VEFLRELSFTLNERTTKRRIPEAKIAFNAIPFLVETLPRARLGAHGYMHAAP